MEWHFCSTDPYVSNGGEQNCRCRGKGSTGYEEVGEWEIGCDQFFFTRLLYGEDERLFQKQFNFYLDFLSDNIDDALFRGAYPS